MKKIAVTVAVLALGLAACESRTEEAVENDTFYVLPYPEFRETLDEIHGRVMAALARPEDDPEYEKRVARGVPGGKRK